MIYLDYNSTHPPAQNIISQSLQLYFQNYGNTSGLSLHAQNANSIIENSREKVAACLGVLPQQIVFSSSATESNAIVLHFITQKVIQESKKSKSEKPRILMSPLEHPSVYKNVYQLQNDIIIDYIPVSQLEKNCIHIEKLKKMLSKHQYSCIILMATHNETGISLPVRKLISLLQKYYTHTIYFFCDIVQSISRWNKQDIEKNSILFQEDGSILKFFVFSGHKIGAGFGASAIILPPNLTIDNFMLYNGGNQEMGIRPGSHNVASIYALSEVLEHHILDPNKKNCTEQNTLTFENKIKNQLKERYHIRIIGENCQRDAGTTTVVFPNTNIDFLLMGLDSKNIFVSTGSSCNSRSRTPSSGILALGYTPEQAISIIRFSYSKNFTEEQQNAVLDALCELLPACR